MRSEDVNVFDFDGTLIRVNSFREITRRVAIKLLVRFQILPLSAIAIWWVLRKANVVSHLTFKQRIVNIFERSLPEHQKKAICQAVFDDNVNRAVFDRMLAMDNCIISTAAPFAYISRVNIGKQVPVISSLDPKNRFPEKSNLGAGKISNLKVYFNGKSLRVANFFTDNQKDDEALIDFAANAFVVEGDRLTKIK
jgi:hypothetical protein